MFQENLIFYGKYSDYMENLNDLQIFERLIDIVSYSCIFKKR